MTRPLKARAATLPGRDIRTLLKTRRFHEGRARPWASKDVLMVTVIVAVQAMNSAIATNWQAAAAQT